MQDGKSCEAMDEILRSSATSVPTAFRRTSNTSSSIASSSSTSARNTEASGTPTRWPSTRSSSKIMTRRLHKQTMIPNYPCRYDKLPIICLCSTVPQLQKSGNEE
ncbi:hypothetical protein L596_013303 [Steinernema carpocapsae]|nr:hypothetical protein L596_013303 [Steinernema carpocapsae]